MLQCPRFFSPDLTPDSSFIKLTQQQEIHHIKNVLRLKKGNIVDLFNGSGVQATSTIIDVSKTSVSFQIISKSVTSSCYKEISLACAVPKASKFDTIIEKSTELGVDRIIPLKTQRTEIKLDDQQIEKKTRRYQSIALNAAKQSKRSTVPKIYKMISFCQAIKQIDHNTAGIIGCLYGNRIPIKNALAQLSCSAKNLIIFIGPEGDFTKDEIALAIESSCVAVDLGSTTLKVDTAAVAAVSFARFFWSL